MRIPRNKAFTLIELSIVLVIIGLIVGGILVGQNLIVAAGVRATITQIEQYNSATNTFYAKYGALPGDMPAVIANQFGFAARGTLPGQGDGNGLIQGNAGGGGGGTGFDETGETSLFWADLNMAGLIAGSFSAYDTYNYPAPYQYVSLTGMPVIGNLIPAARIGQGNYIYVYSGGPCHGATAGTNTINYYGLSAVTTMSEECGGCLDSTPGLTVRQAYSIDNKMDDGLPQSGAVTATYNDYNPLDGIVWAAGGGVQGTNSSYPGYGPSTAATPETTTTCYDNNNIAGNGQQYSLGSLANYGAGLNCALSFQMQGAGR